MQLRESWAALGGCLVLQVDGCMHVEVAFRSAFKALRSFGCFPSRGRVSTNFCTGKGADHAIQGAKAASPSETHVLSTRFTRNIVAPSELPLTIPVTTEVFHLLRDTQSAQQSSNNSQWGA